MRCGPFCSALRGRCPRRGRPPDGIGPAKERLGSPGAPLVGLRDRCNNLPYGWLAKENAGAEQRRVFATFSNGPIASGSRSSTRSDDWNVPVECARVAMQNKKLARLLGICLVLVRVVGSLAHLAPLRRHSTDCRDTRESGAREKRRENAENLKLVRIDTKNQGA